MADSDTAPGGPPSGAERPDPTTSEPVRPAPSRPDGGPSGDGTGPDGQARRRRRGSRGGRNRNRSAAGTGSGESAGSAPASSSASSSSPASAGGERAGSSEDRTPELPDRHRENRPSAEAAERALVRKPRIGDSRPAPPQSDDDSGDGGSTLRGGARERGDDQKGDDAEGGGQRKRRRRGGRGRGRGGSGGGRSSGEGGGSSQGQGQRPAQGQRSRGGGGGGGGGGGRGDGGDEGRRRPAPTPVDGGAASELEPLELDDDVLDARRGRERKGRAVGRYLMTVHHRPDATQISVLEGRSLIEHYVSRPADDTFQIHGNIYLAKVQNVLPGMEAAFVDIGTPKNAVLYHGDTRYDPEDLDAPKSKPRIEQILKARQSIICQVTKNPIAHKGARLTQEVSLPGRFVVLVPNSSTYGISKRLPEDERKRLRTILDGIKPESHGLIVRTAAENVTATEIERDVARLADQWSQIEALAARSQAPTLLYREPDLAVRIIREEFTKDYRNVVIDDPELFADVRDYVRSITPALADRVELYDTTKEALPLLERHHVHEQLHKALDRKVWLPSGGSLIIEHTEALTVIDVNTGKNVGTSSLENTVFANNVEAATEIARQLRLRDIGGIIVIDFVDMEVAKNRDAVITTFREALARDKTRTQVFDISELGLVEMTRKRIGEGLLESFSTGCATCEGRGVVFDEDLFPGS